MNSVVRKLIEDWSGEITIINGHAWHLQSQNLVERGTGKVEELLACHFHTSSQNPWTSGFQKNFSCDHRPAKHLCAGDNEGNSL